MITLNQHMYKKQHVLKWKGDIMNILVIGRGVISAQYAWTFQGNGHSVEFYIRPKSKHHYKSDVHLQLNDRRGKSKEIDVIWETKLVYEIPQKHNYDLILISVNTEQIDSVVETLQDRTDNATVLFLNNFWDDPVTQTRMLPASQVLFGFPGAGGGNNGPNVIRGGFSSTVIIGDIGTASKERIDSVYSLLTGSNFKVNKKGNFRKWLWNHFILGVAMEVEVLKVGNFSNLMNSTHHLGNIAINLKQLKSLIKEKGEDFDTINNVISFIPKKILGFLLAKVLFKKGSKARTFMEGNNTITGYNALLTLEYATKRKLNIITLEKIKHLLPY
jgi:2-dehydropantoate 2-reductase